MAEVAVGVAGAAVGSMFGMPGLGYSVGAAIGGQMFGEGVETEGPRLNDLRVQVSSYGSTIPIVYGTLPVAGNIIWSAGLKETENTEEVGGKGGPSGTQTTYTYSASFAVAICEGPIVGIRRIWADEKMIYDKSKSAAIESQAYSGHTEQYFTIYTGAADQQPDPTIESHEGAGNVPGYRGVAYIVFDDLPLEDYGNRIPQLKFEVVGKGVEEPDSELITYQNLTVPINWSMGTPDPRPSLVEHLYEDPYDYRYAGGSSFPWRDTIAEAKQDAIDDGHNPNKFSDDLNLIGWSYDGGRINTVHGLDEENDDALQVLMHYNKPHDVIRFGGLSPSDYPPTIVRPAETSSSLNLVREARAHKEPCNQGWVDSTNMSPPLAYYEGVVGFPGPGNPLEVTCDPDDEQEFDVYYWAVRTPDALIACRKQPSAVQRDCETPLPENDDYCISPKGEIYPRVEIGGVGDPRDPGIRHLMTDSDGDYLALNAADEDEGDYTRYPRGAALPKNHPDDSQLYWEAAWDAAADAGYGDDLPPKENYTSSRTNTNSNEYPVSVLAVQQTTEPNPGYLDPEPVALDTIVTALCERAGLDSADIDASDLSGIEVWGYAKTRTGSARKDIETLTQGFFFDGLESEGEIKFLRKGRAPVQTITEDDLAAYDEGGQPPPELTVTRTQELELPREVRIHYFDRASDYQDGVQVTSYDQTDAEQKVSIELPVALSTGEAAKIADRQMYERRMARLSYQFNLPREYAALDPSDTVLIPNDDGTHRIRLTEVEYQGILKCKGIAEDMPLYGNLDDDLDDEAYIYTSSSVGGSPDNSTTAGQRVSGPTILQMYDLPALDESADNPGFYYAGYGPASGWGGGSLQRSLDGGDTWETLSSVYNRPTFGTATDVLAEGQAYVPDRGNTVTVDLTHGTLSSITDTALLSYGNLCALGAEGRWEVLQFRDATLNGDGTWSLSHLLRGRFGTEWAMDQHEEDDKFILLTGNGIKRYAGQISRLDEPGLYRAVTFGRAAQNANQTEFTPSGRALEPYAPAHVETSLDGDDLVIEWIRRDRIDLAWRDNVDATNSEDLEQYEVDVIESGTVLRTITVNDATEATYTLANYNSDTGGAAGSLPTLTIKIYQISAQVGRGFPAEVTT